MPFHLHRTLPRKKIIPLALTHAAVLLVLVAIILVSTTHFRDARIKDYQQHRSQSLQLNYQAVNHSFQRLGQTVKTHVEHDEDLASSISGLAADPSQGDDYAETVLELMAPVFAHLKREGFVRLHLLDLEYEPLLSIERRGYGQRTHTWIEKGDSHSRWRIDPVRNSKQYHYTLHHPSGSPMAVAALELPLEEFKHALSEFYSGHFTFMFNSQAVPEDAAYHPCTFTPKFVFQQASPLLESDYPAYLIEATAQSMERQESFTLIGRAGKDRYIYSFLPIEDGGQVLAYLVHYETEPYITEYYHNHNLLVFLFSLIALTMVLANFSRITSVAAIRQQRDELAKVGSLLKGTTDSMVEGLLVLTLEHRVSYCNQAALDLLDTTEDALRQRTPEHYFFHVSSPWEVPREIACIADTTSDSRMGVEQEAQVITESGIRRAVSFITTPLQHEDEKVKGYVMVFRDISRQKEDEERIALLTAAFEQTDSIMIITNHRGTIDYANQAFFRQTGYRAEEVLGKFPRFSNNQLRSEILSTISRGEIWRGEMENRRKNGERFWSSISITPIKNASGAITHYIAVEEDITDRKQMEDNLREAKQAAEDASKAKSMFLANMSHEIRTPMNGILGMTELALQTELTKTQKRYLSIVHSSATSLLTIINDVLDISKVEAGEVTLERSPFDPVELSESLLQAVAFGAYRKGVDVINAISPNIHHTVVGDATRLQQILNNLLGNAIKFTDKGHVILQVDVEWEGHHEVCLHFRVIDTGIGIPADKLESIFENFSQVEGFNRRKYGGTGLGLAISRKLVELMKGELWAESTLGEGSTFHCRLAFPKADPLEKPQFTKFTEARPILVVDDNPLNRQILLEILEYNGMQGHEAASAQEAKGLLQESPDGYDLIILDQNMPGTKGVDFARQIYRQPLLKNIPIILLPSSLESHDNVRFNECHICYSIPKPVRYRELLEAIDACLQGQGARTVDDMSVAKPPPSGGHAPSMNILIVEDNAINRELAATVLRQIGHQVEEAQNGLEALQMMALQSYDVVFMDIQMPDMDGFTATQIIRASEAGADNPVPEFQHLYQPLREKLQGEHTPIVALTANAVIGEKEKGLQAGMDDYLTKPFQTKKLVAVLQELVPAGNIDQETESSESRMNEEQKASIGELPPPVELEQVMAHLMETYFIPEEKIDNLLAITVRSFTSQLAEMRRALQDSDTQALATAAHTIKGALLNIGQHQWAQQAEKLEKEAKENALNLAEAEQILSYLDEALKPVVNYPMDKENET
ncbi:hybrid sensor histidine kinase/response regulator [Desulfurispira natronophila]|uniref:Sensory/regulatory protein RpfC n=1 Tax=Desulfurispira natronophila TaxID=682562 RepID=A0A7W7Y5W8_9BACT|nr:response regulator [Desulfurispira natronophila]MBB5022678.1 PAS domain S-box-containing protein [Desulfurispira natronophila]